MQKVLLFAGIAALAAAGIAEECAWPVVTPEWGGMMGPRSSFAEKNALNRRLSRSKHVIELEKATVFPARAKAGERVKVRFDFLREPPDALPFAARLFFDGAKGVAWREELALGIGNVRYTGRNRWRLEFELALPLYIDTGDYTLEFVTDAFRAAATEAGEAYRAKIHVDRIACDPDYLRPVIAKTEVVNGSPRFTLDGKPFFAQWGNVNAARRPDGAARHSDIGLNVITVPGGIGCGKFWSGVGKFDTACFDAAAEQFRRDNPGAYFIVSLTFFPPEEWKRKYPGEMARDEEGNINEDEEEGEINYSFASEKALDDLEEAYVKAIEHLEHSPYANRIIGYRINSGHTTEWLAWDPVNRKSILDYSEPARRGFAAYAAERFPALKDRSIPSYAARCELDAPNTLLWDQQKHLATIAYHSYYSHLTAQAMIRMCRRAKAMVGGRKLVGSYYGYVMTLNGGGTSQMRAHYALKEVLDANVMDYVMSPQTYGNRSLDEISCDMKPFRSYQDHGVVTAIEDDTRTHNAQELVVKYSQTLTAAQSIGVLTRNMGAALCRNEPNFYYEHTLGCDVDFPEFIPYAKAMKAAGAHCAARGSRRNAEVAIVVSEESMLAMPMFRGLRGGAFPEKIRRYDRFGKPESIGVGGRPLCYDIFVRSYVRYAKAGAPVDYVLAEDLKANRGNYKLYVFPNAYKPTPALREAVAELRRRNCTILWQYAPGYLSESGNSLANMTDFTGLSFLKFDAPRASLAKRPDGRTIGNGIVFAPHFALEDADETIATYADGAAAVAVKKTGAATSVFAGVDYLNQDFIDELYRRAGVHVYSATHDPLEANENLVSLYAHSAGHKTVKLPRKTAVADVFARKLVSESTDTVEFDLPIHSTKLLYVGEDAADFLKTL